MPDSVPIQQNLVDSSTGSTYFKETGVSRFFSWDLDAAALNIVVIIRSH